MDGGAALAVLAIVPMVAAVAGWGVDAAVDMKKNEIKGGKREKRT